MTQWIRRLGVFLMLTVMLAACGGGGGGGGGGSNNPPPPAGGAAPSGLSYTSPVDVVVGTAVPSLTPTVTGSVSAYSVSLPVPAAIPDLVFDRPFVVALVDERSKPPLVDFLASVRELG